jgi:drug/metabolite transporter (DMT)-like permease
MAPLWVFIFFDEVPAKETLLGAALVVAAIVWNIGKELRPGAKVEPAPG